MRSVRFPRYVADRPCAPADWSHIEQLRLARDRADRVCSLLMYLLLPVIVGSATLILFWR